MSRPTPMSHKKRRIEDEAQGRPQRPKKRVRKQKDYHSSADESDGSDDEGFAPVNLDDSDEEQAETSLKIEPKSILKTRPSDTNKQQTNLESDDDDENLSEDASNDSDNDDDDLDETDSFVATGANRRPTSKRNDPTAFSTSISKILSTKLSQSARKDPVLSRSRTAIDSSSSIANERLEKKANAKLKADKREDYEKGRNTDVLGLQSGTTGEVAEEEKRLRKIAQRGVVKLFNAVRAAQVRGELAAKEEVKKGTVGMDKRGEKVKEMSKQGFLDLISGQKKTAKAV